MSSRAAGRRRGGSRSIPTAGRWCVLDVQRLHSDQPQICLLSVGAEREQGGKAFDGPSITSWMSSAVRDLLRPRVIKACETKTAPADEIVQMDGKDVVVRIVPLVDPIDQFPIVVMAFYGDVDRPIPDPPLGGVWRWEIPMPGTAVKSRAIWTERVFELFGITPPPMVDAQYPDGFWWDGAKFFVELVPPKWRDNVYGALDGAFRAQPDSLIMKYYQRPIPGTNQERTQRMYGRGYPHEVPGFLIGRGYTGVVPKSDELAREVGTEPLAAAILENTDRPICVVSLRFMHIYGMSGAFRDLGLALDNDHDVVTIATGEHGQIGDLCHPDDLAVFQDLLKTAAARPMENLEGKHIRLARKSGGYRTLIIYATGVASYSSEPSHQVVCSAADPEENP
jgi:hypothetical protein